MAGETTTLHGFGERNAFGRRNRPAVERILQENLGIGELWVRWIEPDDDDFELDRRLGIDAHVEGRLPGRLTAQVKTLATSHKTVTVESWQGEEPGDLYTCSAAIYVVAYCDGEGNALRWAILDWSRLQLAGMRRRIVWRNAQNGDGRARASFVWCPFAEILEKAPEAVIASGGDW